MTVTVTDVAARAGVSRSAVSRTFTKGGTVSPEMRAKVEAAASELGYRPNPLAAALKTGRTGLVALVIDDATNPVTLAAQAALSAALEAQGRRAVMVNLAGETDPARAASRLGAYHADGALLVAAQLPAEVVEALRGTGRPVVQCFPHVVEAAAADVAGIDNVRAGRLAARKMLARGYDRPAFVGGPRTWAPMQERLAGFRSVTRSRDLELQVQWTDDVSVEAGQRAAEKILSRGGADGYFCADDRLALGVLMALEEAGVSVPDDAGVVGLGDIEMAGWPQFRLTTLRMPLEEVTQAAAARLAALIEAPGGDPELAAFPCQFIERGTLRAPLA